MFISLNIAVTDTANKYAHNIIQAITDSLYKSKHGYTLQIVDVCEIDENSMTLIIWGSEVLENIKLIWSEGRPNRFDIYTVNANGYSLAEREYDEEDVINWITSLVRC